MSSFDQFAGRYHEDLDRLLGPLGATTLEFAKAKADWLETMTQPHLGPARRLSILDVGCGTGNVTHFLQDRFGEVVGADVSKGLLPEARQKAPRAQFVEMPEGKIPFEDGRFDVVFCAGVMHHIQDADLPGFTREMARVTKPGGVVFTFEHNPANPVTRKVVRECDLDRDVERLITPEFAKRLFREAGLIEPVLHFISFFPGFLKRLRPWEAYLKHVPFGGQYVLMARRGQAPYLSYGIDFSLVLPMYNEGPNVVPVAEELLGALANIECELILVDNGSRDDTRERILELAERHPQVRLVEVMPNEGYGWGVLNGLWAARGEALGFMGGDGQVRAKDVVRTYERFARQDVHLAKVSRTVRGDGAERIAITTIYNWLFRFLFGQRVHDVNGTPKIFPRRLLSELQLTSKGWFLDAEVFLKIALRGKVGEVDIEFLPRRAGSSHVRFRTLWEFSANMMRYWLRFQTDKLLKRPVFGQRWNTDTTSSINRCGESPSSASMK